MTGETKRAPGLLPIAGFAIGVGLVSWLFLTGHDIAVAEERDILIAAIWRHVGYGVVLAPLLLGYVFWRLTARSFRAGDKVSLATGWLLSLAIFYLAITGPITVWTYGFPLKVFDWFAIPSITGKMPGLHALAESSHVVVAEAVPWLFVADAVAVLLWPRLSSRS